MRILDEDGAHIATLESVVLTSVLGARMRWLVTWTGHYESLQEPTTTWGSLAQAQTYVEGVVEQQMRLAALKRL